MASRRRVDGQKVHILRKGETIRKAKRREGGLWLAGPANSQANLSKMALAKKCLEGIIMESGGASDLDEIKISRPLG